MAGGNDPVQNTYDSLVKAVSGPPKSGLPWGFKNDVLYLHQQNDEALSLVLNEAFSKPRAAVEKARTLPTAERRFAACKDWIDKLRRIDKVLSSLRDRGLEGHWQRFRSTLNQLEVSIRVGDPRRYKIQK